MKCEIDFLDNAKEFYEPGEKLNAEIRLTTSKSEKIKSKSSILFAA
jgi:hypothetical protein